MNNDGKSTKFCKKYAITPPKTEPTPREREILGLLGFTNEEIAERLFITVRTVKTHVRNILEKVQEPNRTRAQAKALKLGLIQLDEIVV